MEDIRKIAPSDIGLPKLREGFDIQVRQNRSPLPLSDFEKTLTDWNTDSTDITDPKSQENIALAVAIISRRVSSERLLGIKATPQGVSLSFDFMSRGTLRQFTIDLDNIEAKAILEAEHPVTAALKTTDTKIQRALCL